MIVPRLSCQSPGRLRLGRRGCCSLPRARAWAVRAAAAEAAEAAAESRSDNFFKAECAAALCDTWKEADKLPRLLLSTNTISSCSKKWKLSEDAMCVCGADAWWP